MTDPIAIAAGLSAAQRKWIASASEEYPGGPIRAFPPINTHIALIRKDMMDFTGALYGDGLLVRQALKEME